MKSCFFNLIFYNTSALLHPAGNLAFWYQHCYLFAGRMMSSGQTVHTLSQYQSYPRIFFLLWKCKAKLSYQIHSIKKQCFA